MTNWHYLLVLGACVLWVVAAIFLVRARKSIKRAAAILEDARHDLDEAQIIWNSIRERSAQVWVSSNVEASKGGGFDGNRLNKRGRNASNAGNDR